MSILLSYNVLLDLILLGIGFAFSQWIVLRAGVFSIGTAALVGTGAYCTAILSVRYNVHPVVAVIASMVLSGVLSLLLSLPLARLRGVYQAIATLAFVQVFVALNIYAENLTGGAQGFNGIPKIATTFHLLLAVVLTSYVVFAMNRTRLGRAFDAIRQDEAVATSLGISITAHHRVAFVMSGLVAGLFGSLDAFHSHSLVPEQYGFGFVVAVLASVVLGGRHSILGPAIGTIILLVLPELLRPLADFRMLIYGAVLVLVIIFWPRGLAELLVATRRRFRSRTRKAEQPA